jgi:N-acetylglucosamine-6-phosphate deacetylase
MLAGANMAVDGAIQPGLAVWVRNGRIAAVGPDQPGAAGRFALPKDALLAPGFVDAQVNGGGGVLFNDTPTRQAALAMAAAHRRLGTTAILPTLITDSAAVMRRAADAAEEAAASPHGGVHGIHFEGPFLSQARPGVHSADLIRAPLSDDIEFLRAAARRMRVLLTAAPETLADADIATLSQAGIILSAGHSAAAFERVSAAMANGLRGFTHMFNAMAPPTARAPGITAAALSADEAFCGVIADLIHVHPAMLALLLRCKRRDRIMLVSDSMAVAGTDLVGFSLQGKTILRRDGMLATEDGTLAGADLDLAQAVRNMAALPGVTVAQAVAMASEVPAAFLRLDHEVGRIAPGCRADFCLLGPELEIFGTWVGGDFQKAPGA